MAAFRPSVPWNSSNAENDGHSAPHHSKLHWIIRLLPSQILRSIPAHLRGIGDFSSKWRPTRWLRSADVAPKETHTSSRWWIPIVISRHGRMTLVFFRVSRDAIFAAAAAAALACRRPPNWCLSIIIDAECFMRATVSAAHGARLPGVPHFKWRSMPCQITAILAADDRWRNPHGPTVKHLQPTAKSMNGH